MSVVGSGHIDSKDVKMVARLTTVRGMDIDMIAAAVILTVIEHQLRT